MDIRYIDGLKLGKKSQDSKDLERDISQDNKISKPEPKDIKNIFSGIDSVKIQPKRRTRLSSIYPVKKRKISTLFLGFVFILITILGIGIFTAQSNQNLSNKITLWQLSKDGRYLILFQNNSELRATGGFLGSYAVLTVKDRKMADIYFETNVYKKDNQFIKDHAISPPEPIRTILGQEKWSLHDANWAIDFKEAAKTVAWFYQQEGDQPVDGVIGVDTTMLQDILKLTGPIELGQYNLTINSDNFLNLIQYQVEKAYWQDDQNKQINEPKTILKELLPKLIFKLKESPGLGATLALIEKNLKQKHILLYFENENQQSIVEDKNWAGRVPEINHDYLYINNSNLGVNKSSLNIKQNVKLKVSQTSTGQTLNELTVIRSHTGSNDWPDGNNIGWERILVPKGSELVRASLDETDITSQILNQTEAEKTSYAFKLVVSPKTSKVLKIIYRSKITNENKYQLYYQIQPGALPDNLEVSFNNNVLYSNILETDKIIKE